MFNGHPSINEFKKSIPELATKKQANQLFTEKKHTTAKKQESKTVYRGFPEIKKPTNNECQFFQLMKTDQMPGQ